MAVHETAREIVGDITKHKMKKVDSIYLVACGGSLAALWPAKYLLSSESKTLNIGYYTSNEFVHSTPKACSDHSIVILCSRLGTPETVRACSVAKGLGASVIALVGKPDAEMCKTADYSFVYSSEGSSLDTPMNFSLALAFELLYRLEDYSAYEEAAEAFGVLDDVLAAGLKYALKRAEPFGKAYKDESLIYLMGSGPNNGIVYSTSICSLIECQWIHSVAVNSGEYFHGPFETTDKNLAFIFLISTGRTRALDERAHVFLTRYGEKITTIDTKELGIDRIGPNVREFFNASVLSPVLTAYTDSLAQQREHPKTIRQYMWKVAY